MENDLKKPLKIATASQPVQITGLKDTVAAGDKFLSFGTNSRDAQIIGEKLNNLKSLSDRRNTQVVNLDELNKMISDGSLKEIPIIIKADVHGAQEALANSLENIEVNGVRVRIVHKNIGAINESDVNLALTSNAVLIGFNTRPDANAKKLIDQNNLQVMEETVIYKILETIEETMKGMREKIFHENILGHGDIIDVFKISNTGRVAGVLITDGKFKAREKVRLIRDGEVIIDTNLSSLKHFKDEVKEMLVGQECGITLANYDEYKKGDQLEAYELIEEIQD